MCVVIIILVRTWSEINGLLLVCPFFWQATSAQRLFVSEENIRAICGRQSFTSLHMVRQMALVPLQRRQQHCILSYLHQGQCREEVAVGHKSRCILHNQRLFQPEIGYHKVWQNINVVSATATRIETVTLPTTTKDMDETLFWEHKQEKIKNRKCLLKVMSSVKFLVW